MTPKQAKKLLCCSYPTLISYVKRGFLKATKHPINGYMIYDDNSVIELYCKINNNNFNKKIIIYSNNKINEYDVNEKQLNEIYKIVHNSINDMKSINNTIVGR